MWFKEKSARRKPEHKQKEEATRRLTKQHLANRFDDTKQKGLAFFEMSDSRYQTRHLILKNGYLFQQTASSAGLIHSHLRLAFCQRQTALKIQNP
jgi:hypothetical protein